MKLSDLRGKARADQFKLAAEFAGVSPEVFQGIWRTESSEGKNMLSPAGAEGHFGLMPATRQTWEKRTGAQYNPNDFTESLYVSALTMRENMGLAKGNLNDALRIYNAGTDRTNWNNEETRAYVGKVLGHDYTADQNAMGAKIKGKTLTMRDLTDMPTGSSLDIAPKDMEKALRSGQVRMPEHADKDKLVAEALSPSAPLKRMTTNKAAIQDAQSREAGAGMQHSIDNSFSPVQKFAHAAADLTLTASIIKQFTRDHPEQEEGFGRYYVENWKEIEKFAQNEHEASRLRRARSKAELAQIQQDIAERRGHQEVYAKSTSDALIYGGLASVTDPAGLALGAGVGKGLQVFGVGSRVLLSGKKAVAAEEAVEAVTKLTPVAQKPHPFLTTVETYVENGVTKRRTVPLMVGPKNSAEVITPGRAAVAAQAEVKPNVAAGVASLMAEGAGANLLADATLDALGDHKTTMDYAIDGGLGLFMGAAVSPFVIKGVNDETLRNLASKFQREAAEKEFTRFKSVQDDLGPDATPDEIMEEVTKRDAWELRDTLRISLAPVDAQMKFLQDDPAAHLTTNSEVLNDISARYNLAAVSDETERSVVAELIARSEAMSKANPVDTKGVTSVLAKVKAGDDRGWESTGMTLMSSNSPVARSVGQMLLEGTTGAGGRRRTAAMSQVVRERLYNRHMVGYDDLYHLYRNERGVHIALDAVKGDVRADFGRAVAIEIESRNLPPDIERVAPPAHPAVSAAADLFEKGMDHMRIEQQHVGTVGAARLGNTSTGYFMHRLDPKAVAKLSRVQQDNVRKILSNQFVSEMGYDRKFSDTLAAKYLERAIDKRYGMGQVPFNLHDPEAADIVNDTLKALGIESHDADRLLAKFSRGGAGHTKGRLRLDLLADIGDDMKLIDLFSTDITALYRSYARRVSGEVALAQYGIMGKKGLDVLKQAMKASNASEGDMAAFDQISSEFLNLSYGSHNHNYMDNIRIATSLSRLGGMGFTQFGEYGNGLAAVGLHRTFNAIGSMPRLIKEVGQITKGGHAKNPILDSIDLLGGHIGLDEYTLTRLWDVPDNSIKMYGTENIGVTSRALRLGGNLQAILSGHRMITAVQTRGMAEQIVHKLMKITRDGLDDAAIRDMGISPKLQAKIKADLPNIAEFDGKGNLTKLDLFKSKMLEEDIMEMRDAIERGASQIIQRTYTGETGKWAHNGFLKILAQFRTFSLTAVEKQWGRNARNYGALKSAMYLLGAMSFAAPIHAARVHARTLGMSRSEREEYIQKNMDVGAFVRATMGYASASGLLGDIYDVGVGAFSSWFGDEGRDFAETIGVRGGGQNKFLGGVIAPGASLIEDLYAGVRGDPHKLLRAMPFSNLPYIQPLVNFTKQEDE